MRLGNLVKTAALAAIFVAGGASASVLNLVANGSFEANKQAAQSWNIYSNLDHWTGGSYGVELRNSVAGAAFDGNNYVELDANHNSDIVQVINTEPGGLYALSFAYAPREGVASTSNGIEVFWNGMSEGIFTGTGNGPGNVWVTERMQLSSVQALSTLKFRAVGADDSYGGSLDNVVLTHVVPEPGSAPMLLLGLGLLGIMFGRKARLSPTR